jgi:endonuclease YncB( thermonuclease family)
LFPWRKRNQGFEWREYVRTEILVRRRERRQKLEDAKASAVFGVKQAGRASASAAAVGASAAAQGAASFLAWLGPVLQRLLLRAGAGLKVAALHTGAAMMFALRKTAAGLSVVIAYLGAGLSGLLRGAVAILGPALAWSGSQAARLLEPVLAFLRQPTIQLPLALMTAAAGISALFGILTNGLDSQDMTAAAIALAGAALLLIPRLVLSRSWSESTPVTALFARAGDAVRIIPVLDRLDVRHAGAFALVVLVALIAGGAWLLMEPSDEAARARTASRTEAPDRDLSSTLEGRAVAVTGDSLRFAEVTVMLDGIEAPERDQQCLRGDKRWRCGEAAKDALARAIRGKRVSCNLTGTGDDGKKTGSCTVRGADIAEALVREGHVFAQEGLFSRYATEESDARRAGAGVWAGEPERPAEYRAKRWEEARRAAPEGCPIKGRVASGSRVYVLPWSPAYDSVRVVSARGERWFCSEEEAQAAGWRLVSPSS